MAKLTTSECLQQVSDDSSKQLWRLFLIQQAWLLVWTGGGRGILKYSAKWTKAPSDVHHQPCCVTKLIIEATDYKSRADNDVRDDPLFLGHSPGKWRISKENGGRDKCIYAVVTSRSAPIYCLSIACSNNYIQQIMLSNVFYLNKKWKQVLSVKTHAMVNWCRISRPWKLMV